MKLDAGSLSFAVAGLAFVLASCKPSDGLSVSEAWIAPTVAGQTTAAAYMNLLSSRDADLVNVETDVARTVEIHHMSMNNDVMSMRRLNKLELPAHAVVKLEPGGRHLMLLDLKQPLTAGNKVDLTLTLKTGQGRYLQERVVAKVGRTRTTESGN